MKKWAFDPKNDISKVKTVNNDPSCHLEWPKTTDVILSRMVKDWSKASLTGDPNGPKGLELMCNCKRRSEIISDGENLAKSGLRWSKTILKR